MVSKYVNKDWKPVDQSKVKHFYLFNLPEPNLDWLTPIENFGSLCIMSLEERKGIEELWEEIA